MSPPRITVNPTTLNVYSATDTYEIVCYVVSSTLPTLTWIAVPPTDQLNYSSTVFDGGQYVSVLYVTVHTGGDFYQCTAENEGGLRFGRITKSIMGMAIFLIQAAFIFF